MKRPSTIRGKSGLTVVELLVVVVCVGIMAAVAIPVFSGIMQNSRFRAAADTVVSDIRQARAVAVTRGNFAALRIATGPTRYRIERSTTGAVWPADADTPLSNPNVIIPWQDVPQLYPEVTVSQPVDASPTTLARVIFNSLGNSVATVQHPITITITSPSGTSRVVQVTAVGSVRQP